jgi:hypothetical protein
MLLFLGTTVHNINSIIVDVEPRDQTLNSFAKGLDNELVSPRICQRKVK